MVWYVKSRNTDGTVNAIPCHNLADVTENLREQRARGREHWIEDTNGKRVEPIMVDESALGRARH